MDIENFLITYMIDIYEQYCYYALNMTQDDFDTSFYDSEGNELDDREYLMLNYKDIINEETLESLYEVLISPDDKEIELDKLVSYLTGTYFLYNYNPNDNVIKFLKDTPLERIQELFMQNCYFGIDLLRAYFESILDKNRLLINKERVMVNGDTKYLNDFFNSAMSYNFITLTDILRNVICNLYNNYIENGYDDIEALNATWHYFISGFDPLGELDQMGIDVQSKEGYKRFMLGIIISDVYEDVCNDSIIESDYKNDRIADVISIIAANFGMLCIPNDEEIRNRLLKHFILLQDEKIKKYENRNKTYQDKRIGILKKVNPLYPLDDISFRSSK